jgi:hypothetical protein
VIIDGKVPMDRQALEDALSVAAQGVTLDWPFPQEVLDALDAVAIARPSERRAVIREARRVFRESTNPGPIN